MKKISLLLVAIFLTFQFGFGQEKIKIALKEDSKPLVYIDGIQCDASIVDLLDQTKIKSVDVIKGEKAMKEYNAPNGVVLITSVDNATTNNQEEDPFWKEHPMVIINGKVSDKASLKKIDPKDIDKIEVLKGEKALEKYNAKNGVIIVKTKLF